MRCHSFLYNTSRTCSMQTNRQTWQTDSPGQIYIAEMRQDWKLRQSSQKTRKFFWRRIYAASLWKKVKDEQRLTSEPVSCPVYTYDQCWWEGTCLQYLRKLGDMGRSHMLMLQRIKCLAVAVKRIVSVKYMERLTPNKLFKEQFCLPNLRQSYFKQHA